MANLCFVTTCMGRLHALRRSLGAMVGQGGSCIVVDYSCPEGAGDWVVANHPRARVIRVPGQASFNASAARNIESAALPTRPGSASSTPTSCSARISARWCRPRSGPGGITARSRAIEGWAVRSSVRGPILSGLAVTMKCTDAGARRTTICTTPSSSSDFEARELPERLLSHLAHDDAERTRHYPVADRVLGHAINRVYRILKWDVARVGRELLNEEMRPRALRKGVRCRRRVDPDRAAGRFYGALAGGACSWRAVAFEAAHVSADD